MPGADHTGLFHFAICGRVSSHPKIIRQAGSHPRDNVHEEALDTVHAVATRLSKS